MAYNGLRDYIKALDEAGELVRVKVPVDPILEVSEIADRLVKSGGPAVLFEDVKGHSHPLAMNLYGTQARMCMALGVESFEEVADRITEWLKTDPPPSLWGKVKMLPRLKELTEFIPKHVSKAPCQEVVNTEMPSFLEFPIVKTWPMDGGRFITLGQVFTHDPNTGMRNCGMYRVQIYDKDTAGMHWQIHKDGADHMVDATRGKKEKLEVAIALGTDPVLTYSATAPMPKGLDEMIFAGFVRHKRVEMVKAKTIDVDVPADAEIVFEGYVEPGEVRTEGPFGDHTGYYSLEDDYPVFHLTCVTHRKNPIYPATVVGVPPMEDGWLGKATERIFLPLMKLTFPEIVDINLPISGVFHNLGFVSIDKRFPGHARKVMHALWGMGQMMFTKMLVIFDADVNVQDIDEVMWRWSSNIDPGRDVEIVKGPVDVLTHAAPYDGYGTKIGFDATTKWESEGFTRRWPPDIEMDKDVVELVTRRWKDYGFK